MHNFKELILVIIVSGAMLGLGMSTTKYGSIKWKKLKCQSNLKEIYKLADQYQSDHNGNIVTVVNKTKHPWGRWYSILLPYTDNPTIFYCPANPKAENLLLTNNDPLKPNTFGKKAQSYGMNASLGRITKKKVIIINIKDVKNPGYLVYFGDSKDPSLRGTKWCWEQDYAPRHSNKSNFVFMDGSVKLMDHKNLGLCQKWKNRKKDRNRWQDWEKK